ncbi:hypothetical protein DMC64_02525 [Amycolatopsis sp. WAC 04197]|uniref:hypothetical protein n=1 Tax=Amycolatopsis sp. WAC 04197 TaxID=2203199 RepID=UPI000F7AF993|nr:hypothetical protein [Amycolatopsis sp. WAC 04197]RSN49458.1 hypothetical protein DMC64_02525 [Amycolatopsis sp. WAC 04197]
MDDSLQALLPRLGVGPAFVLLGQASASWTDDQHTSSLPIPPFGSTPETYLALAETLSAAETGQQLAAVADFPWNGVFTSRIDSALERAFSTSWRRVRSIGVPQLGRNPRSTTDLQIRHLFGGTFLPEDERPPSDPVAEVEATARAGETLGVLAERLVTPRGVVVIDGYQVGDWLTTKDLFVFLMKLGAGQVHLFSATSELLEDKLIGTAVDRNLLCTHTDTLAQVLHEAEAEGRLDKSTARSSAGNRRLIPAGRTFVELGIGTWNQVISAARPIDTTLLEPFPAASPAIDYERFRNLIGYSDGAPPFKAVASGYKLRRDFEDALLDRVQRGLKDMSTLDPIIVSGQTATGKSLALCSLALDVARSGQAAVLHQARRGDRPAAADIEQFALWADEVAELPTLLIWDAMVDDDNYYSLQKKLRARGRRVLIVGSSYRVPGESTRNVVVDVNLSKGEVERARTWLDRFGLHLPKAESKVNSSFLALLYRLVPDSQFVIQRGLTQEARHYEAAFERLAKETTPDQLGLTTLARALADAGYDINSLRPSERPHEELIDLSFSERSTAEQLTAVVLVAGKWGLTIPLELALRVIGRDGWSNLAEIVSRFDLFRWEEDRNGEQLLGVRTQLEAELLAREDLSTNAEIGVIRELIENLRPDHSNWGGVEVDFIVALVDKIGHKSPDVPQYARHWLDVAEAFKALREKLGTAHHRLVLAEANLTREYAKRDQGNSPDDQARRLALLVDTQHLLEETIDEAQLFGMAKRNLLVELGSTIGTQVYEQVSTSDSGHLTALMKDVIRSQLAARQVDPENYYPVDVVAWTTSKALENAGLGESVRLDLLANAHASLASVDSDGLSPSQRAQYDLRYRDMARLMKDPAMELEHLESLKSNNDPAAFYFLARLDAQNGTEGKLAAVKNLLDAPAEVREDWRCSRLLLDLFWELKTGKKFLRGQREVLAFTTQDWDECIEVVHSISTATSFERYRLDFLHGLALFHLGQYRLSESIFRDLDQRTAELSSRVVATYVASNENGAPQLYSGRVTWTSPDGRRGKVWLDKLSIEVAFIPRRFSGSESPQRGDTLTDFHIAFNMRGALADPARKLRQPEGGTRHVG